MMMQAPLGPSGPAGMGPMGRHNGPPIHRGIPNGASSLPPHMNPGGGPGVPMGIAKAPQPQQQQQQQQQQQYHHRANGSMNGPIRNGSIASSSSGPTSSIDNRSEQRDIRATAELHYRDLLNFLQSHLAKAQTRPRSTAREKLTRLSKQQFTELSTDVYDELVRRQRAATLANQSPGGPAPPPAIPPHLEVRPEFHPKRNQARQKLATLPKTRFKDLASDVFFELERRFPEFAEQYRPEANVNARRTAAEQYDRDIANGDRPPPLPTNSAYLSQSKNNNLNPTSISSEKGQPRSSSKQSQNAEAKAEAAAAKKEKLAQLTAALGGTDFGTEENGDDTTLAQHEDETAPEDDVQAPMKSPVRARASELEPDTEHEDRDLEYEDDDVDGLPTQKKRSPAKRDTIDDRSTMYSQTSSVGTGFLNGYAGSSVAGGATGSPATREGAFSPSYGDAIEKLRSDYEFRIAQLQAKATAMENERDAAIREAKEAAKEAAQAERERMEQVLEERIQDELSHNSQQHEERYEDLQKQLQYTNSKMEYLDAEHNELLDRFRSRDQLELEYSEATSRLRDENDNLLKDFARQEVAVHELKSEVASLLDELKVLTEKNDELVAEQDNDQIMIRELNMQLSAFKRRYENARSELRAFKATSQLFVQPAKLFEDDDDGAEPKSATSSELRRADFSVSRSMGSGPSWNSMLSDRGAIADVHMRAFQVSIDELLASARSLVAGNVLTSMKTVVLAATLVTDDVAKYENGNGNGAAGASLNGEDREALQLLKSKASAALSNLMSACRTYASSQGLSPVSLLDAAASHISTTVIDIVKLVRLRKASAQEKQELDATFGTSSDGSRTLQNGLKPLHIHAGIVSNNSAANSPISSHPNERAIPSSSASSLNIKLSALNGGGLPDSTDSPSLSASNSAAIDGRFSPRGRTGSTMGRYSPVGYRPDATRKDSTGEGSWQSGERSAGANGMDHHGHGSSMGMNGQNGSFKARGAANMKALPAVAGSRSSMGSDGGDDAYLRGPSAAEEREDNWAELRNYITVQTEGIVHSIQNLLAAIREGAQGVQLNENLTQITTIVSSIVAISKENLPSLGAMGAVGASPATVARANEAQRILQELSVNCDRLSEMQTRGGSKDDGDGDEGAGKRGVVFNKATKTAMASASYGVAKGLKALSGLLDDVEAAADDLR